MTNDLLNLKKNLKSFAKRCKDFKYTDSALLAFLLSGMLISTGQVFAETVTNSQINNQVSQINTSINQMRTDFKRARAENNKLIKDTNLELTQLMEQGDHVTKSPWSSWQFGANGFYSDWHGTYKGKGNKISNIIYKRDQTLNKYIAKPVSEKNANNTTLLGFAYEPNAEIPISASITPKSISKVNPNIKKNVTIAGLPSFEPRVVVEPLEPAAPKVPDIIIPTFNVNVNSYGNGEYNVADGEGSNSTIQQVIINSGNFFVSRTGDNWDYHYDSYSGKSMWGNASTDNPAYSSSASWSNWSRGSKSRIDKHAFQSVIGSTSSGSTMISNGKFIYTRNETGSSELGEFAHLDVHGASAILTSTDLATATSGLGTQSSKVQTAYNEAATITGATTTVATNMHTWINSGTIILEGSDTSLTNTYTHEGDNTWKQASINTGTVIFQPSISNGRVYNSTTAGFVISKHSRNYRYGTAGARTNHNVLYNSGTIKSYSQGNAMFAADSEAVKPVTIVNKGTLESYGESSAGVFIKSKANVYFDFDKPIVMYGDKSIGFYNLGESSLENLNAYKAAEGNLKIDIGASGKGNENFTATSYSGYETQGTNVSTYSPTGIDVNPNDTVMIAGVPVENRNIQSSFGILSNEPMNLTNHQIRIYDKTEGNVGVMPHKNVQLKLGNGSIELNGGEKNIGIYVTNKYVSNGTSVSTEGAVESTGDVKLNGGKGNLAIYAKGSTRPSGVNETVSVRKVISNNTENSVAIFASDDQASGVNGSVVKVTGGIEVKNATVSANPTIAGQENAGAVYATGKNTSVNIDMPAISPATTPATPTTPNIEVKGKEIVTIDPVTGAITGTGNYTGFGLYAGRGAQISAKYNNIKVEDGGTAVASVGSDGTNASNIDLSGTATNPGSTVEYKGKGYALFSKDGGKIDLSYGTLTLRGEATGYSRDVTAATPLITLTDTKLNVFSNDVIVANLTGVNTFNTNNSYINGNPSNTIGTYIPITKITNTEGGTTYNGYKYTVFDDIDVNVDSNIDKADTTGAGGTTPSDSYIFTRRLQLQNSRINVLSGNTVKAHLNTTEINDINSKLTVPVGLDISASGNSKNNTTTAINVQNGATISVDRTDSGNGGVGAYVNYGKVHNEGKIEVEKPTPNDHAVGIYATNGTEVNNDTTGTVEVGGKDSIGILGLSYRIDSKGNVVYEKFGTTGTTKTALINDKIGLVDVKNSGKITLDGDNSLGIYAKNNSLDAAGTNADYLRDSITYTNAANDGEITMTGKNAIGMIIEGGIATNDTKGKITISGQEGVAMYGTAITGAGMAGHIPGKIHSELNNKGTIDLADTTTSTPIIGMFTNDADTDILTSGTINVGKKSYGVYGASNNVSMTGGTINVGDDGVGIFATGSSASEAASVHSDVNLTGGTINVGNNQAVGVFIADDATNPLKTTVYNSGTNMTVGTNAFGYVVDSKTGTELNLGANSSGATNTLTASIGTDSVYAYTNDKTGSVFSNTNITTTGGKSYGIYAAGEAVNYGTIDLTGGTGNVGIYSTGTSASGAGATNRGVINVGSTNVASKEYGIGMATGYYNETTGAISNEGLIENRGTINVLHENSIGMYAVGSGSKAINHAGATIDISGKNATGMYIDQGAEGINYGTIKSTGSAKGIKGVATVNGGYIKNYGTISITSPDGIGIYQDAASALSQKNVPGNVSGTKANVYSATSTDQKYIVTPKGTLLIQNPPKTPRLTVNGREVELAGLDTNTASPTPSYVTAGATTLDLSLPQFADFKNSVSNAQATELGMYVDTSGVNYTHPIEGLSNLVGLDNINLIIGTEASKYTDAKAIEIGSNIIKPYNDAISSLTTTGTTLNINSAGLTWLAQPLQGTSTPIEKLYMIKIPYTFFTSEKDENSYNFLDGLEQRYGVEGLGTRERQIFDKLNGIGKGETELFTQAVDEMKGHQYSNTQQRINATGNALDKEFRYLRHEWRNPSKQNNKIKAFGLRDEYNTDTAGVIDYTSNAYGVAYVHEDEKIRMGNSSGWYAGAVTNRFRFKDIGKSREQQTMLKLGVFKTMSPKGDHNGALQWTIGGDVFAGINNMKRKFWVVDDTFEAKSTYHTYGAALKNELGYDIRMSERTHLRPYGALKMEYGRFNDVKEDSGQMRLEVKGNDYFSVKPEAGLEFKYVQPLAVRTNLTVGLTAAYENELGKLQNGNQARVRYTTAGWYNLEKEKEDRRGNGKFDLNIGIDNTRFGVTVNAGYDTKGNNVRGGIGFRAIY